MLTNYAQYNGQVAEKASRRWLESNTLCFCRGLGSVSYC